MLLTGGASAEIGDRDAQEARSNVAVANITSFAPKLTRNLYVSTDRILLAANSC